MDYPKFIVSNQKEEFISIQRVKGDFCTYEPAYGISVLIKLSCIEGSGQPAQMCRIARALDTGIHIVWMYWQTRGSLLMIMMVYLKIPVGNNAHEDIQHNIIYKHGRR